MSSPEALLAGEFRVGHRPLARAPGRAPPLLPEETRQRTPFRDPRREQDRIQELRPPPLVREEERQEKSQKGGLVTLLPDNPLIVQSDRTLLLHTVRARGKTGVGATRL